MLEEDICVLGNQKSSLLGWRVGETSGLIRRVSVDTVESAEIYSETIRSYLTAWGKSLASMRSNYAVTPNRSQTATPRCVSIPLLAGGSKK